MSTKAVSLFDREILLKAIAIPSGNSIRAISSKTR